MGSALLTTLSIFLGIFFIFGGSLKLTPQISRDMYLEIGRNYIQYSRVFPFAERLGVKVSPTLYQFTVGFIEFFAGIALAFTPGCIKQVANVLLLVRTVIAFYTHLAIGDKFEQVAPSVVFSIMLICRLFIRYRVQNERRAIFAAKEAAEGPQNKERDEKTVKKEN